jgi:hypothetical protein
MSNKAHSDLTPTDRIIRDTISATWPHPKDWPEVGTLMTVELVQGFEKFNTRPYHNYETWSNGYRVKGRGITVEREDLDEAIGAWHLAVFEEHLAATCGEPCEENR